MKTRYSPAEVIVRAKQGLSLNLRELAIASGYGYSMVRKWYKAGLPLMDGRITLRDAMAWRKAQAAGQPGSQSPFPNLSHHPLLTSGRFGARE
jgi:hypothetical protein